MKKISKRQLQEIFYVGREIYLIHCLSGPCFVQRTVKQQTSYGYIMLLPDGRESHLRMESGRSIEAGDNMVAIYNKDRRLMTRYSFEGLDNAS